MLDYDVNPKVRDAGKMNFLTDKKGANVAMLIELQGRAIAPKTFKSRKSSYFFIQKYYLFIYFLFKQSFFVS
jgi:hypothetical protein